MVDNVELDAGSGGAVIATDEDGSANHHQWVKNEWGADGTFTPVDTGTSAFPVQGAAAHDAAVAANPLLIGAEFDDTTPDSVDEGDVGRLRIDAIRSLYVTLRDAAGNERGLNVDSNGDIGITNSNINTMAADIAQINGAVHVDGAVWSDGSSRHMLAGGIYQSSPQTITSGRTGPFQVTANGYLITSINGTVTISGSVSVTGPVTANLSATDNAVLDNIDTQTTPAQSFYRNIDANAEAAVKASAGVLHWLHVINVTSAVAYLHLYDATTASVTPGSTTPDLTFAIPTQGDTNGAGFALPLGPNGQNFGTAITLVCTTTLDGSAGDPGTNGVIVNAGYT